MAIPTSQNDKFRMDYDKYIVARYRRAYFCEDYFRATFSRKDSSLNYVKAADFENALLEEIKRLDLFVKFQIAIVEKNIAHVNNEWNSLSSSEQNMIVTQRTHQKRIALERVLSRLQRY